MIKRECIQRDVPIFDIHNMLHYSLWTMCLSCLVNRFQWRRDVRDKQWQTTSEPNRLDRNAVSRTLLVVRVKIGNVMDYIWGCLVWPEMNRVSGCWIRVCACMWTHICVCHPFYILKSAVVWMHDPFVCLTPHPLRVVIGAEMYDCLGMLIFDSHNKLQSLLWTLTWCEETQ